MNTTNRRILQHFAESIAPILSRLPDLEDFATRGYHSDVSRRYHDRAHPLPLGNEHEALMILARSNPQLRKAEPVWLSWSRTEPGDTREPDGIWTPRPAPVTMKWWVWRFGRERAREELLRRWGHLDVWLPEEDWMGWAGHGSLASLNSNSKRKDSVRKEGETRENEERRRWGSVRWWMTKGACE